MTVGTSAKRPTCRLATAEVRRVVQDGAFYIFWCTAIPGTQRKQCVPYRTSSFSQHAPGTSVPGFHVPPLRGSGILGLAAASFFSMTTKAWRTSFSNASKLVVNSTFFGLITTSAPGPGRGRVRRTASRKRRFMRLRWTAPPRARPTVNPIRRPGIAGTLAEPAVCRSR